MARLDRVVTNILVKDLTASADFYRQLCGFATLYESDWYVMLSQPGEPKVQLGLIDRVSEFTPRHAWGGHEGAYLTLVVDDVFSALQTARELGVEVIEEPTALAYGQTRALIRDPNGFVVDLSTPTEALVTRENVRVEGFDRSVAIDQPQPGDAPTPLGPPN